MNFDAFSHGQIVSKIWLCQELAPYIDTNSTVYILGSWYNLLAFMLCVRQVKCREIIGIDIDRGATDIANKICNTWNFESPPIKNLTLDANTFVDYVQNSVVINCSAEHFDNNNWFDNIPSGTITCIQSTNLNDQEEPWLIKQPTQTFGKFITKYFLPYRYYLDIKNIKYTNFEYNRYMIIGKK